MKRWFFAVAIAAVASFIVAATASAGVERYQTKTGTLTVNLPQYGLVHTFQVDMNPCDNSFTGTGFTHQGGLTSNETIKGELKDGQLSFRATYTDDSQVPGYEWWTTSAGATGAGIPAFDTWEQSFNVTWKLDNLTKSDYKNHGDYVKSMGGGADAAHSCIGMPLSK
jgi:hypothetical protein